MGAFAVSAIAWTKRLVFPVLEKYSTEVFMISECSFSSNILFAAHIGNRVIAEELHPFF